MGGYAWVEGAAAVAAHAERDWEGLWSLLFAAGKAAYRLSLVAPPDVGAVLAFAAMDVCEARDEVAWAHPEVSRTAIAVDLGPVAPSISTDAGTAAILLLLQTAAERVAALEAVASPSDSDLIGRIRVRIRTATTAFAGTPR